VRLLKVMRLLRIILVILVGIVVCLWEGLLVEELFM